MNTSSQHNTSYINLGYNLYTSPKQNIYFITATNTGHGKTEFVRSLVSRFQSCKAIKPVATGLSDKNSDPHLISIASGMPIDEEMIKKISPFSYVQPISPHVAMKLANTDISLEEIAESCVELTSNTNAELILIEGVGGAMSPINRSNVNLELAKILNIPIILISKIELGCISSTLAIIESCNIYDVPIATLILNSINPADDILVNPTDVAEFIIKRFPNLNIIFNPPHGKFESFDKIIPNLKKC